MQLLTLQLSNFRGFYDYHELEFAHGEEKHVTVLHGKNGGGKTNLLNAIHWCISGKLTPGVDEPDQLINADAYALGVNECYVELSLRSSTGTQYRIRRTGSNKKKEVSLEVFEISQGNSKLIDRGESLIQSLLPAGLVSWFFFDSESIANLELTGGDEFKSALRKTLGFELVDSLVKDLDTVQARLRRKATAQTNNVTLDDLQKKMNDIEHILPGQQQELATLEKQEKEKLSALKGIHKKLSGLPQAAPIEKQRDQAKRKKTQLQNDHKNLTARKALLLGKAAPSLMLSKLTALAEGKLQDQEIKGKLPSPIGDVLIKDIFEEMKCICGTPLKEGSEQVQVLKEMLKFATTAPLNERIREVRYLIRNIDIQSKHFPTEIVELRNEIISIDRQIADYEEEIKEFTKTLEGIAVDEISKLESQRQEIEREIRLISTEKGRVATKIEMAKKRSAELKASYEREARTIGAGKKLRAELEKVERIEKYIRRTLEDQETRALKILQIELNHTLKQYMTKHRTVKINPRNYAVTLFDSDENAIPQSTGEGQVVKFAFIAAVVALAAKKTQERVQWMTDPTIAPLVMDAPFSTLDPEYAASVARNLSEQSTQLILLTGHWGDGIESAINGVTGRRYLLLSRASGPQGDKPITSVSIKGEQHILNSFDEERTESVIKEVTV